VIDLFLPADVQAMDRRAFARGVGEAALMERAAGHLVRGILAAAPRRYGLRVAILCGKGNNGGDGLAAARLLQAHGAQAAVHLVDPELSGLPLRMLERWRAVGGRTAPSAEVALRRADVAVDCLLGTGTSGAPRGLYADAVRALQAFDGPVVACDLPTGVDAATGQVHEPAVHAEATVTLGAHKLGLWVWPARGRVGALNLGEIGVVDGEAEVRGRVLEPGDVATLVPAPRRTDHKRTRGVVVVLAGSPGMSGAATLVARGAMAAGAGLVMVGTAPLARHMVAPTIPEALTLDVPDDDPDAAFEVLAGRLEGADALAVGPGLGLAEPTQALVRRLVREVDVPLVLDADGLNAFRHDGDALADHAAPLLVVTPHTRELARLLGPDRQDAEVEAQRLAVVPDVARRWRAVVVSKGPGSLVAAHDGSLWVNPTGSSALATGGTGDVLTGMTAALVAQRPTAESVAAAVWLHGRAGEVAGERTHPRSVTALDVAAAVPTALRRLPAPHDRHHGPRMRPRRQRPTTGNPGSHARTTAP
jgi:ADP-dependent NAD(P)H-hydrate dehydratase / NAD(P)H-hydrate epimerase